MLEGSCLPPLGLQALCLDDSLPLNAVRADYRYDERLNGWHTWSHLEAFEYSHDHQLGDSKRCREKNFFPKNCWAAWYNMEGSFHFYWCFRRSYAPANGTTLFYTAEIEMGANTSPILALRVEIGNGAIHKPSRRLKCEESCLIYSTCRCYEVSFQQYSTDIWKTEVRPPPKRGACSMWLGWYRYHKLQAIR